MDLRRIAKRIRKTTTGKEWKRGKGQLNAESGPGAVFYHCPWHSDRRASFAVYPDSAKCFQCDKYFATPKLFLMGVAGYKHEQIVKLLSGQRFDWVYSKKVRPGIVPPSQAWRDRMEQVVTSAQERWCDSMAESGREELHCRRIWPSVVERYRIGWHHSWDNVSVDGEVVQIAEGITFPVQYQDSVWSLNIRTASGRPKYYRVKTLPYPITIPNGLQQLGDSDILILTESDTELLLIKSAVGNDADVLAMRGTSNRIEAWKYLLMAYDRVLLCFDGDDAGQMAAERIHEQYPTFELALPPLDFGHAVKKQGWSLSDVKRFILEGRRVWL